MTVERSVLQFTGKSRGGGIALRNHSAIPFRVRVQKAPDWLHMGGAELAAESIVPLGVSIAKTAPAGSHRVEVELEIANLHPGPGRTLTVRLPLDVTIAP